MAKFEKFRESVRKSTGNMSALRQALMETKDVSTLDNYLAEIKRVEELAYRVPDAVGLWSVITDEVGVEGGVLFDEAEIDALKIDAEAKLILKAVRELVNLADVLAADIEKRREALLSNPHRDLAKRLEEKAAHYERLLPSFRAQAKPAAYSDVKGFLAQRERVNALTKRAEVAEKEIEFYGELAQRAPVTDQILDRYLALQGDYDVLAGEIFSGMRSWKLPKGFGAYLGNLVKTKPSDVHGGFEIEESPRMWNVAMGAVVGYTDAPPEVVKGKEAVKERVELIRAMIAAMNSLEAMPELYFDGFPTMDDMDTVLDTVADADLPEDLKKFKKEFKRGYAKGLMGVPDDPKAESGQSILGKLFPGRKGQFN